MGITCEGGGSPRPDELRTAFTQALRDIKEEDIPDIVADLPVGEEAGPTFLRRVIAQSAEAQELRRKRVKALLELPGNRRKGRRSFPFV